MGCPKSALASENQGLIDWFSSKFASLVAFSSSLNLYPECLRENPRPLQLEIFRFCLKAMQLSCHPLCCCLLSGKVAAHLVPMFFAELQNFHLCPADKMCCDNHKLSLVCLSAMVSCLAHLSLLLIMQFWYWSFLERVYQSYLLPVCFPWLNRVEARY